MKTKLNFILSCIAFLIIGNILSLLAHIRWTSIFMLTCLLMISGLFTTQTYGQCTNTFPFGNATLSNSVGGFATIGCNFADEYGTWNGAVTGNTYNFTSTVGTDYITIHTGSPAGPVAAFGTQPLSWTSTVTGTIYVHINTNAACGTSSTCRSITGTTTATLIPGCTNTFPFGNATLSNSVGGFATIGCNFADEYGTWNGVVTGNTYNFTSTVGTDYMTIHTGSPAGPVAAFGTQPLSWTSTVTGTIYVHINTNAACGTIGTCRTIIGTTTATVVCDIQNVNFLGSPSTCNDNGTPSDPTDDFFTHNINANFFNRPNTGSLQIVPGGDAIGTYSIPVNQIIGNAHTFNAVQLKADGTPSVVQFNFTDEPTCIGGATGPTVNSCSNPCSIPNVDAVANQTFDVGDVVPSIVFTSNVPGAVFSWSRTNEAIGLGSNSGTGNVPSFSATNTSCSIPIAVTFSVVATYTVNAVTCTGTPIQFTITVNPIPTPNVDAVVNQTFCADTLVPSVIFTSNVPEAVFSWSRTNEAIGLGSNSGTGNVPSFTAANSGTVPVTSTFSVVAVNGSCTGTPIQFSITIIPPPTITCPASITLACNSVVQFGIPTVSGGFGNLSLIEVSTIPSIGADGSHISTRTWRATDDCGNTSTCSQSITVPICEEHCSYSQGFYGNQNGKSCTGLTATQSINLALVPGAIVTGCSTRTITINPGQAACVVAKLPGGTTAAVLPLGNVTCATATGNSYLKQGRFKSVLLAQTLALSLNIRLDNTLGALQITNNYFSTYAATSCLNGASIAGTRQVFYVPQSVRNCIGATGTVNDLLTLANKALGGGIGVCALGCTATLGDIIQALDALNKGFDKCRILGDFASTSAAARPANEIPEELEKGIALVVYPNPFSENAIVEFTFAESANATIELFDITGKRIAKVFNGHVEQDDVYNANIDAGHLADGIYFLTLNSSKGQKIVKKIVLLR